MRRGFALDFIAKRKKPTSINSRSKVVFYTTRPQIFKPKRERLKKLVWQPKFKPKSFRAVATPLIKVGIGVVLAMLVYVLFGTPLLTLTKFDIQGNHLVETEDIQKAVFKDGFKPVNALLFRDGKARQQILSIPQIREAHFHKNILKRALIAIIDEHETTIIWQSNNERFMVNRMGVVYDIAKADSPLIVVEDLKNVPVNLNQKIVATEFIEFVTAVSANLPRKTNLAARRVLIPETTYEIEVITSDGWKIILDTTRSVETQLNNLVKVLRTTKTPPREYVDLRIDDRVYYK
ncbi:MAG: cell division protein FtsQ/DivIB [Patescibacteria group bacterium]|jgi:cell division septal protein FtsQ